MSYNWNISVQQHLIEEINIQIKFKSVQKNKVQHIKGKKCSLFCLICLKFVVSLNILGAWTKTVNVKFYLC